MGGIKTGTVWLTAFRDQVREKMLLFYLTFYCVMAEKNVIIDNPYSFQNWWKLLALILHLCQNSSYCHI